MGGGEEDVLALGAALVDVVDVAALPAADSGWVGLGEVAHLPISGFWGGKFSLIFGFFSGWGGDEVGKKPWLAGRMLILLHLVVSPTSC